MKSGRRKQRRPPSPELESDDSDDDVLDIDTLKQFTIPKRKKVKRDLLESLSENSREFQNDILPMIRQSYRDRESSKYYQYTRPRLVHNETLLDEYIEKKHQMKSDGYSEKELVDTFCFLHLSFEHEVKKICEDGLKTGNTKINSLGDPTLGVYISRHADIISPEPFTKGRTGILVVFKVIKGRIKFTMLSEGDGCIEPTPNYDCHMVKTFNIITSQMTSTSLFNTVQMYAYEYTLDADLAERPRQVLPFAVLSYRYQGMPSHEASRLALPVAPQLTRGKESKQTREQIRAKMSGSAAGGLVDSTGRQLSAEQSEISSVPDKSDLLSEETILWSGFMRVEKNYEESVELVGHFSTLVDLPACGSTLTITQCVSLEAVKSFYLRKNIKFDVSSSCRQHLDWYQAYTRLRPVMSQSYKAFNSLSQHLNDNQMAGFVELQNGNMHMLLVPVCKASAKLGLTTDTESAAGRPFLHCVLISRTSCAAQLQDSSRFRKLELVRHLSTEKPSDTAGSVETDVKNGKEPEKQSDKEESKQATQEQTVSSSSSASSMTISSTSEAEVKPEVAASIPDSRDPRLRRVRPVVAQTLEEEETEKDRSERVIDRTLLAQTFRFLSDDQDRCNVETARNMLKRRGMAQVQSGVSGTASSGAPSTSSVVNTASSTVTSRTVGSSVAAAKPSSSVSGMVIAKPPAAVSNAAKPNPVTPSSQSINRVPSSSQLASNMTEGASKPSDSPRDGSDVTKKKGLLPTPEKSSDKSHSSSVEEQKVVDSKSSKGQNGVASVVNANTTQSSNQVSVVRARLDPRLNPRVDPMIESKADPRLNPRLETKVDSKLDPRLNSRVDPRLDAKADHMVDSKADPRVDFKADPRLDPRLNPNVDSKLDPRLNPRVDPSLDTKADPVVDPKADPRIKSKADLRLDPRLETKVDSKLDPRLNPRVDPRLDAKSDFMVSSKIDPKADPRIDSRLDPRLARANIILKESVGSVGCVDNQTAKDSSLKTSTSLPKLMDLDVQAFRPLGGRIGFGDRNIMGLLSGPAGGNSRDTRSGSSNSPLVDPINDSTSDKISNTQDRPTSGQTSSDKESTDQLSSGSMANAQIASGEFTSSSQASSSSGSEGVATSTSKSALAPELRDKLQRALNIGSRIRNMDDSSMNKTPQNRRSTDDKKIDYESRSDIMQQASIDTDTKPVDPRIRLGGENRDPRVTSGNQSDNKPNVETPSDPSAESKQGISATSDSETKLVMDRVSQLVALKDPSIQKIIENFGDLSKRSSSFLSAVTNNVSVGSVGGVTESGTDDKGGDMMVRRDPSPLSPATSNSDTSLSRTDSRGLPPHQLGPARLSEDPRAASHSRREEESDRWRDRSPSRGSRDSRERDRRDRGGERWKDRSPNRGSRDRDARERREDDRWRDRSPYRDPRESWRHRSPNRGSRDRDEREEHSSRTFKYDTDSSRHARRGDMVFDYAHGRSEPGPSGRGGAATLGREPSPMMDSRGPAVFDRSNDRMSDARSVLERAPSPMCDPRIDSSSDRPVKPAAHMGREPSPMFDPRRLEGRDQPEFGSMGRVEQRAHSTEGLPDRLDVSGVRQVNRDPRLAHLELERAGDARMNQSNNPSDTRLNRDISGSNRLEQMRLGDQMISIHASDSRAMDSYGPRDPRVINRPAGPQDFSQFNNMSQGRLDPSRPPNAQQIPAGFNNIGPYPGPNMPYRMLNRPEPFRPFFDGGGFRGFNEGPPRPMMPQNRFFRPPDGANMMAQMRPRDPRSFR